MKNQKNRGITLLALVITIVVLVILVGVSVSVAINTGVIANSKKAVADYDEAQIGEKAEIKKVEDIINSMDPNSLAAKVKVGDYVEYTPVAGTTYTSVTGSYDGDITTIDVEGQPTVGGTQGNGYGDQTFTVPADTSAIKWRVIGIENGKVNLASEVDEGGIGISGATTDFEDSFVLQGLEGVVYGNEELDAVCSIYGTGTGAEGARSINTEDINSITGFDVTKDPYYKDKYGEIAELEEGSRFRNTFYENCNNHYDLSHLNEELMNLLNKEWSYIDESGDEVFEYNYYFVSPVCFGSKDNTGDYAGFTMRFMNGCFLDYVVTYLYYYEDVDLPYQWMDSRIGWWIRPVVTLKSNLKVASDSGDGSVDSPWKFE